MSSKSLCLFRQLRLSIRNRCLSIRNGCWSTRNRHLSIRNCRSSTQDRLRRLRRAHANSDLNISFCLGNFFVWVVPILILPIFLFDLQIFQTFSDRSFCCVFFLSKVSICFDASGFLNFSILIYFC